MKLLKKLTAIMVTLGMAAGISGTDVYAGSGPNPHPTDSMAYLCIAYGGGDFKYLYNASQGEVTEIDGAEYDKSTNTMTLNNYKNGGTIVANEMGDDLKIKVEGTNNVQSIMVYGYGYGGSLELTGNGTLTVNENREEDSAIFIDGEIADSVFKLDRNTGLKAYGKSKKASVAVIQSKVEKNGIVFEGNEDMNSDVTANANTYITYRDAYVLDSNNKSTMYVCYPKDSTVTGEYAAARMVDSSSKEYYALYNIIRDDELGVIALKALDENGKEISMDGFELADDGQTIVANMVLPWRSTLNRYTLNSNPEYKPGYGIRIVDKYYNDEFKGEYYYVYKFVEKYDRLFAVAIENQQEIPIENKEIMGLYTPVKKKQYQYYYFNDIDTTGTENINNLNISLSKKSYIYNGKVQTPTVKVTDKSGKKVASSEYKITYAKGRKNVGKYSVKITFKGKYSGTVTKTYTIVPKTTSITKAKAAGSKIILNWKKQNVQSSGYQIQYALDSSFKKSVKTVNISSSKTVKKNLTGIKKNKKYYVRIRTYKSDKNSGKIYSSWSSAKIVKS